MTTGVSVGSRLPALDGVRGLAILAVLVGHGVGTYGVLLSWGGVTLFFVLSGYLITGRLASGQTLRRFYANRARRLLPALLVLLAVTGPYFVARYGVGWWTVIEPAVYVRNLTAGHFGNPASPYPHMWSLAMEEQFYLLWPLAFIAWPRLRARTVAALGAASLVMMVAALSVGAAETARFSPITQAWPLCLGCLLMLRAWSPAWPPWLSWSALRWFGVRSYGIYLWHYPLMVVFEGFLPRPLALPLGCVAGVLVAVASWRWVESPWLRRPATVRPELRERARRR